MTNSSFFSKKKEFFTLKEVLEITDSKLLDNQNYDLSSKVYDIASLDNAKQGDISFLNSALYVHHLQNTKASFCFLEEKFTSKVSSLTIPIINNNPYYAYAKFLSYLYYDRRLQCNDAALISSQASIEDSATIGKGSKIAAGAYVGENVIIGNNCYIGPNSSIGNNCQIGDNCYINSLVAISYCIMGDNSIVHNGAKIGQDGFGFAYREGHLQKILQMGIVEIGSDVEIGANSCIDRGAIGNTTIGNQVKIDNLVQIAHNVILDQGCLIAGCVAIAGSTKVGKFVQIGGNASIAGHITIGDGVKIAGASGVTKNIPAMQSVGGCPAVPIKDWHRMHIKLMQLIKISKK